MYITFEDYIRWYSPISENVFERLAIEACRTMDKYTTGIDSVRKLKKAFPAMMFDRLSPCSGILSLRK